MSDILLADDTQSWRELAEETFLIAGFSCDFAVDGEQAIDKLENGNYKLVCLNWKLKDYQYGKALLGRLNSHFPTIPVILTTGFPPFSAGSWHETSKKFDQDLENLQARYPNLKKVIIKSPPEDDASEFIDILLDEVQDLLGANPKSFTMDKSQPLPSARTIHWLHLSDLHMRKSFEQDKVLKQLLFDIEKNIKDKNWRPDFVVVTGDIAFSATNDEYKLAVIFFDKLLDVTGLTKKQLFLIPGNHDVDWTTFDEYRKLELDSSQKVIKFLEDATSKARIDTFLKFKNYGNFINSYFVDINQEPVRPFSCEKYFYVDTIELHAGTVVIMGLNSAWASALMFDFATKKTDDYQHLILGEPQIDTAIELAKKKKADLVLALVHHPLDWIVGFDQEYVKIPLYKHCDLVLHGHLHEAEMGSQVTPEANIVVLKAGTAFEHREYKNGYSYVKLDLGSRKGIVSLRRYTSKKGGYWIADNESHPESGSEVSFDLP